MKNIEKMGKNEELLERYLKESDQEDEASHSWYSVGIENGGIFRNTEEQKKALAKRLALLKTRGGKRVCRTVDFVSIYEAIRGGQEACVLFSDKRGDSLYFLGQMEDFARRYLSEEEFNSLRQTGEGLQRVFRQALDRMQERGEIPLFHCYGFSLCGNEDLRKAIDSELTDFGSIVPNNPVRTAIDNVMEMLLGGRNKKHSAYSQLSDLFQGKLDERTLEGLTRDVDAEFERVTLQTGSTGVVRFNSDGKIGYGKVSQNQRELENEHRALTTIKSDGLARILAPTPIGIITTEDAGALFTWGTENRELYNPEDVKSYFNTFNTFLFSYAQQTGANLAKLAKDPAMQDVFNRALIHSSRIAFDSVNERPSVLSLDELETRAKSNPELLKQLRTYNPIYLDASKRIQEIDQGEKVFIHGDARTENNGKDPFGVRPLVDWTKARMGSPAQDLTALGTEDTQKYLGWYNFVMDMRGAKPISGEAIDSLISHDIIHPYRTGSFMVEKGRVPEAKREIQRLARNSKHYGEYFKR